MQGLVDDVLLVSDAHIATVMDWAVPLETFWRGTGAACSACNLHLNKGRSYFSHLTTSCKDSLLCII